MPKPAAAPARHGSSSSLCRNGLDAHTRILRGDRTETAGERAAHHFLDSGELPTAVVAFNDRCAIGVLAALARAGVAVPDDVSVAGYDDDTLSRLSCFDLTTVSQGAEEQARRAIAAAVERLGQGRTEPREIVLPPHLVARTTTGRATVPGPAGATRHQ
ncbi:substrate-binding domain-containing protein [Streptomyces oryzae]|uniref:Substrate-binding domain-containing protein n=1 Tax=Streptomyces oryzae TaxID=1434886 RepID=A0ABS3X886_9ACTN|nr:substrate-binding domain-containing protein [Streptomyces oryzae]MBO8191582.1 substrate-binding domain-containing protein [Streptomyces oryzae]